VNAQDRPYAAVLVITTITHDGTWVRSDELLAAERFS
jgi:hypothetical protein